jgi:hypothetical protein
MQRPIPPFGANCGLVLPALGTRRPEDLDADDDDVKRARRKTAAVSRTSASPTSVLAFPSPPSSPMAVDLPTKVEDPAPDGDTIEAALDRTPYKTPLAESDMDDLIAQFGKLAITVTQKVTIPWPPMDQPVDYSDAPVYVAPYKTPLAEIDVFTSLFAQLAIKDNAHEMSRFLAKHRHLNEALAEAYLKCPDLRDNYLAVMGTIVG